MKYTYILIFTAFLMQGCKRKEIPENAAREYCECLKQNNSPSNYLKATKKCDQELSKRYRLFKIFQVDMSNGAMTDRLSESTKDSAKLFIDIFWASIRKDCCYETSYCDKDSLQ